jgi:N-acetylmuramoyl-L-alanine amidase
LKDLSAQILQQVQDERIKLTIFMVIVLFSTLTAQQSSFIIILDPAGDAKKTGRSIGDSFERGLTLQCAEKIKSLLLERHPHITVIISRLPGDNVYELQNASLANRIQADLFININFYLTQETKPTIYLYQFACDNDFALYQTGLACNTYDQAYKINKSTTDAVAQHFKTYLTQYVSFFNVAGPYALPIKPLIGIISPNISLEIGLKNKDAWQQFVEPIVSAIIKATGAH